MDLPLMRVWTLSAPALPERLLETDAQTLTFRLPGADALSEFAALLGIGDTPDEDAPKDDAPCAPFPLPALIPEDVLGLCSLSCEIDFGAYAGDTASLFMDSVCGCGEVMLTVCPRPGEKEEAPVRLSSFHSGPLSLDLTQALSRRRRCRVTLHFDESRPAGVLGAVMLRVTARAALGDVCLRPQSALRTLTLKTNVTAAYAGDYLLRAQLCPPIAPDCAENAPPIREVTFSLQAGESKAIQLAMEASCEAFTPGKPYAAPALKLWLHEKRASGKPGMLCDERILMCGFPGITPESYLPLNAKDAALPPQMLIEQLKVLHVTAVSLPVAASDLFYREMTRAGIAVRQTLETNPDERARLLRWPCVTFDEAFMNRDVDNADPALSAWRLCGLVTYPRTPDPDMIPADMLQDAAGRPVGPADEQTQAVLAWLRAVSVRLRAEAIRQGQLRGAYCAPGEWNTPDIAQALETALAPLHLSVLPLCGAWWTCSRLSASVHAFLPEGRFASNEPLRAEVILEDAQGETLASAIFPCPPNGGALGIFEATLPERACVLELTARLYNGKKILEEHTLPIYVGERGPLEAAF